MNTFRSRRRAPRPPAGWRRSLACGLGRWALVVLVFTGSRAQAVGAAGVGRLVPDRVTVAQQTMLTLPAPPDWQKTFDAALWTVDDVKAEFAKLTDTPPRVNSLRAKMLRPDHAWLLEFKRWFARLQKPLKMHFEDQLWDCDNYADAFVTFADLLTLRAGEVRGSLSIGWASVTYQTGFAGIRAGGVHAVVIIATTQGLYILEPQDGTMVALRDFPNRDTIEEVYF